MLKAILGFPWTERDWEMLRGEHLLVHRFGYTHHGIAIDNWKVIEYAGDGKGGVRISPLSEFRQPGQHMRVRQYASNKKNKVIRFSKEETESRAKLRLNESTYDLFGNNCEHFANWCAIGVSESRQVRRATGTLISVLATGIAATSTVVPVLWPLAGPVATYCILSQADYKDISVNQWLLKRRKAYVR